MSGDRPTIKANQILQDIRFAITRLENARGAYVDHTGENLLGTYQPEVQEAISILEGVIKGSSKTPSNVVRRNGGWIRKTVNQNKQEKASC